MFLLSSIIIFLIILVIYQFCLTQYFDSPMFNSIRNKIVNYTNECNDLNDHIESLKATHHSLFKHVNYGQGTLSDHSIYGMKRKFWKHEIRDVFVYQCSSTVLKNANNQPFKYICKYFSIKPNEETLEKLETVLNNFSAVEQGKYLLEHKRDTIVDSVSSAIHPWVLHFHKRRVNKELGFKEIDLSDLYFPVYSFQYISAGGNSSMKFDLQFDPSQLEDFIFYLFNIIQFKKSVLGQRSLMTSALREKIKQRDHFTCQICNLSIREEKNLLLEIDHIIPLAKGGYTSEKNLQTLCWKCNRSKGTKIL